MKQSDGRRVKGRNSRLFVCKSERHVEEYNVAEIRRLHVCLFCTFNRTLSTPKPWLATQAAN